MGLPLFLFDKIDTVDHQWKTLSYHRDIRKKQYILCYREAYLLYGTQSNGLDIQICYKSLLLLARVV